VEASATVSSPNPSESPAARLVEATGLLHDIRVSLDARYETESGEDEGREIPWRGIGVALAAFVPTFLSIVLGAPLLLATTVPPASQGPARAQVGGAPLRPDRPRRSRGPTTAPPATRGTRGTGSLHGPRAARRRQSSSRRPTW